MAKFKVGDKVRVVSTAHSPGIHNRDHFIGKTLTIKSVNPNGTSWNPDGHYGFGGDASIYVFYDNELELVYFTKADLKDGMVVEYRKGKRRLVFNGTFTGIDGYLELSDFNDDLMYTADLTLCDSRDYDIVKVYDIKFVGKIPDIFDIHNLELIWERPEEEYKEMTVEEIEKALGCKIKVVGEKNG